MSALRVLIASIRTAVVSLRALADGLEAAINRAEHHPRDSEEESQVPIDPDWDRISSVASTDPPAANLELGSPGILPGSDQSSYDAIARSLTGAPPVAFECVNRLGGSDTFVRQRIQRAWEAGLWAKATLSGKIPKPRPTPQIGLRNQIYVVLRAPGLSHPVAVSTAAEYYQILPRFTPDSVSHSFPSIGEAKAYCLAAEVEFPALLR
eukprot:s2642_g10.t1